MAVSLAALLLGELKQKIRQLELEPAGGGCFEVHVDGKQLWSKLETGEFPDEQQLLQTISGLAHARR